jgi:MSHA pilin protein MshC
MPAQPRHTPRGFSLVELVVVMTLVAVVASVGFTRLTDDTMLKARRFATDAANHLSIAQRLAMAQRRTLYLNLDTTAGTLSLCLDAACTTPIAPAPDQSSVLSVPTGLRFSATASALSFDASGRPSNTAAVTLRVLNTAGQDLAMQVTLEPETGHVRLQAG